MTAMKKAVGILLAAAALAAGIELTSFRLPRLYYDYATFSLYANARVEPDLSATGRVNRLWLHPELTWQSRLVSEPLDWEGLITTELQGSVMDETSATQDWGQSDVELTCKPSARCDAYIGRGDWFGRFGLDGEVEASFESRREANTQHQTFDAGVGTTAEAGVGYGRVRDAWPLLKAVRLTRWLEEESLLVRPLSDDEMTELAGFLARSWRLFAVHDRAARFYYDSLSFYLLKTGAIDDLLPAHALFRLDEEPYFSPDERLFGWRVFLTLNLYTDVGVAWVPTPMFSSKAFQPYLSLGGEYARLFGQRWTLTATAGSQLDLQSGAVSRTHVALLGATGAYDVTDRLNLGAGIGLTPRYTPSEGPPLKNQLDLTTTAGLAFRYYLTGRLGVLVQFDWQSFDITPLPPSGYGPLPYGRLDISVALRSGRLNRSFFHPYSYDTHL
jgi:hypothetical protein